MRGRVPRQQTMFVAFDLEQFVPADHPLRKIKRWADGVLGDMSRDFSNAYGTTGKPGRRRRSGEQTPTPRKSSSITTPGLADTAGVRILMP